MRPKFHRDSLQDETITKELLLTYYERQSAKPNQVHRQYINYHHSSRQVKIPLPINFQHDSSMVSVFILPCDRNSHPSQSNETWCNGLRALSSALVISIVLSFVQVTSRNVPLTVFLIMWHDGRRSTTRTMKKLAISGFASQVLLTSRPAWLEVLFSIIP